MNFTQTKSKDPRISVPVNGKALSMDNPVKRRRVVASTELDWRACGNGFTLHLGRSKPLLSVVPDATYSGMWRISHRGRLSDMANLTRAKDAGLTWALGDLNRGQESPEEAPTRVPSAPGVA